MSTRLHQSRYLIVRNDTGFHWVSGWGATLDEAFQSFERRRNSCSPGCYYQYGSGTHEIVDRFEESGKIIDYPITEWVPT